MNDLMKLLVVLAFFGIVLFAFAIVAMKLGLLGPATRGKGAAKRKEKSRRAEPYRCVSAFLSAAEFSFYRDLMDAVTILTAKAGKRQQPLLFAKPRLGDVLETDSAALKLEIEAEGENGRSVQSLRASARNSIQLKHIDFLLCDSSNTKPLLVIELDDRSHDRPERRERDEFLDRACAAAGLAILHIPCRPNGTRYDPKQLAEAMFAKLEW